MYTTTLRRELPGPVTTFSGWSGSAACILAQAGSFERSSGLGLGSVPLRVTLPVTRVPEGPARRTIGLQKRERARIAACASRIPVKPPDLGIPWARDLAEVQKRGAAELEQTRKRSVALTPYNFDLTGREGGANRDGRRLVQSVTNFLN